MSLQARSLARSLAVDETLYGTIAIGLLEAEGIELKSLPPEFTAERDAVTQRMIGRFAGKQPSDIPGVAESRELFHRLGVDPTKTRPSNEALLRRVLKGKGMPEVNTAVDVCNLCSLEHQLPLGLYDRDKIKGPIEVRLGATGEGYAGIRKQRVNLSKRLLLSDDNGPFGAPTSDSAHTCVSQTTTNLLVVVFCPPGRAGDAISTLLEQLTDRLGRYCNASVVAARVVQ
jgi:DNA/RNA-binding domain of Phe-tRNA-synthetase-like protein